MKNSTTRGRALAQAVARIHWSIAFVALDSLLEPAEPRSSTEAAELSAALRLVDEALAELRDAYRLVPAELSAAAIL